MIAKLKSHHRKKLAYVYIRQSTQNQVLHHQESTERQFALQEKALEFGWEKNMIKVLDGDLGLSGAQSTNREGFKALVSNVSLGKVGAVFALEASRLSRSNTDWHRLLELCSLTETLIIDEDGCYDPTDFNDQLLLGLKGTMSQAELHFLRARLHGGKINKARKGLLKQKLPIGYCYDEEDNIIIDPNKEVQNIVKFVFATFEQVGSAYGIVKKFHENNLKFPKRSNSGIWKDKIIWGTLSYSRVLTLLRNPFYAGVYFYGRHNSTKKISQDGELKTMIVRAPMEKWKVSIMDHHETYITWEQFKKVEETMQKNKPSEKVFLNKSSREGKTLLQGILICGKCGYRMFTRYMGDNGIYPKYICSHNNANNGMPNGDAITVSAAIIDEAIKIRILEVIKEDQIKIAINAAGELETRNNNVSVQLEMKLERLKYEADLEQRRYEEVDPSNRLVATTLEKRWNDSLIKLEEARKEVSEFKEKQSLKITKEQKNELYLLAKNFRNIWNAPSTKHKDRKRIVKLLIKDVTLEKNNEKRKYILHIRWQGDAFEDVEVDMPKRLCDILRYPENIIERVRQLSKFHDDKEIANIFNTEGMIASKGGNFTTSIINYIRQTHSIDYNVKEDNEFTIPEVAKKFEISKDKLFYWVKKGYLTTRKAKKHAPNLIKLDDIAINKIHELINRKELRRKVQGVQYE